MSKVKNPSTSDVKQRHKRKGKRSPPHSSRGRIGTATIKKNIDAAARRADERVAAAMRKKNKPRPAKKPTPPKVPTIKAKPGPMKRRPTMEEQLEASGVGIDYGQLDKMAGGGQVYKRKHGGKVIKGNMTGEDIVNACYVN